MKYGWRERISGAVILVALAVIFVPLLLSEPAPRSERPQPVLTIEQPIEVPRGEVEEPRPPATLGEIGAPLSPREVEERADEVDEAPDVSEDEVAEEVVEQLDQAETAPEPASEPAPDPIAELARAADQRLSERSASSEPEAAPSAPAPSPSGEWAVQVGSFGEPANAERLLGQLREQGFPAYSRPRDNNLTTVYVGPFDSSESGEQAMNELKTRANLQGLLVRARN